jgi:hypothetical protein
MSDAEWRAEHGYAKTEAMLALEGELQARQDEIDRLREERRRLREALAFAQSAIKSGEPWTQTCEDVIGAALREEPYEPW